MTELADSLREAIHTCECALTGELLPHQVDAWKLWELLSNASDRLSQPEEYLCYANLMRLIVATVRLQCRWLRYEADELYVDSDIAREKVNALSMRTLNSIFLKSFHPLVEVEQLTSKALEMGKEHWEELSGEGIEEEMASEEFFTYGNASREGELVIKEVEFRKLLDNLEQELVSELGEDGGEISYGQFLSRGGSADFPEMVTRSYLGSFLISEGRFGVKAKGSDLKLTSSGSGRTGRTQSLAVILKRPGRSDNNAVPG